MSFWIIVAIVAAVWIWMSQKNKRQKREKSARRSPSYSDTERAGVRISITFDEGKFGGGEQVKDDAEWMPPGRSAVVGPYTIPNGMVYVGRSLAGAYGQMDAALINPKLKINQRAPDTSGASMSYYPAYDRITPEARAAYLNWLSDGRNDPNAAIGYVFLFFYGLERRLLRDAGQHSEAKAEAPVLLSELDRLIELYGKNSGSFRYYATSLRDFAALTFGLPLKEDEPLSKTTKSGYPLGLRIRLAIHANAGKPIPAHMALAWFEHNPETRLPVAARRCSKEFRTLFALHYRQKFGDGMVVKPNKTKLKAEYTPASATMTRPIVRKTEYPDLTALSTPIGKLQDIVDICAEDLSGLSRAVGRDDQSILRLAYVPVPLLASYKSELAPLHRWLTDATGLQGELVGASELLDFLPSDRTGKADVTALWTLAGSLGFGIEPDPRFFGGTVKSNERLVVFRFEEAGDRLVNKTPDYEAAALLLHLSVMVSQADGVVSGEEEAYIREHIERSLHLSAAERRRLHAYVRWLSKVPQKLTGTTKRISLLAPPQRLQVAQFLTVVASADGHVSPEEIRSLERIYKTLDIEADNLYSHLHAASIGRPAATPVEVQKGESQAGYTIPKPPAALVATGFKLDESVIAQTLKETREIHSVLAGVFSEDEAQEMASTPETISVDDIVAGLDVEHSALLRQLSKRASWALSEVEALCSELRLLAGGAIEVLNEVAYALTDAPVLEGDDPLEIDINVAREMMEIDPTAI